MDAITVDPYLICKTPPDSMIEKLVVTKVAAAGTELYNAVEASSCPDEFTLFAN